MKYFLKTISLAALGLSLLSSCKKEKEDPDLTVLRTDTVYLGTTKTTDTIDVLANDTYFDLKEFSITPYGVLKLNQDSTVAVQMSTLFYGTHIVRYYVTDKNGMKTGSVVIKRGNAEQLKTISLLKSMKDDYTLPLFAIDGDTNGVYQRGYSNCYINKSTNVYEQIYLSMSFPKLSETIPHVFVDDYKSILADGTIYSFDNSGFPAFYKIQDGFTAQAKTLDGKRIVTVTGYTIYYQGHTLDFINGVPAE